MLNTRSRSKPLSELEHLVMEFVWSQGSCTADQVRESLAPNRPMKDSTVRTVLRRMEKKGYIAHLVEGRTYLYRSVQPRESVAIRAVKQIIDRFCGGSVEQLLIGMVDSKLIERRELDKLAQKVAREKRRGRKS